MTRHLKEFVNHETNLQLSPKAFGPEHVAVLLAHFNGATMLGAQLESLARQSHRDWSLIISDDGSPDDWLSVAGDFAKSQPKRRTWLTTGPKMGFAQNFLFLAAAAGPHVPFAAFCDQDDVWLPDKLKRALAALRDLPPGCPALYCGRTMICDRMLEPIAPSPLFCHPPAFANALVQSIGGGNTMVMNRAALDLLQDTRRHAEGIVSHDWWAYQLVTGAGGRVIYDPEPGLLYRQHGSNSVGANTSLAAQVMRVLRLLSGRFRAWNAANSKALHLAAHWLTPDARAKLDLFDTCRTGRLPARIRALR